MAQKPARLKNMNRDMAKSAYSARNQIFVGGITRWCLIALVLSLGFGQLLRFAFLGVPLYLHDILIAALLIVNIQHLSPKLMPRSLQVFSVGLTLGWLSAIFLFPHTNLFTPFLYTLRLLAYLALYLTLKSQKIRIPHYVFIVSGIVALTIGLLQYFFMPDMRVFQYLGWDDHLNRLILPHFDPTFSGIMLVLFLLSLSPNLWYLGLLALLGILLTYARSVWLSVVVTTLFFVKPRKLFLLLIPVGLIAILLLPRRFGEGNNLLRTYSISSRVQADFSVVKSMGWNLFFGEGMNTFALATTSAKGYPNHATGPNDSYLYLLATTGLLGLFGFLLFMKDLYKKSHYKPMIVFILIASLFNNVLFYPFALLWVLLIQLTDSKSA